MIIVGSGALQRRDGSALLSAAGEVASSIVHPTDTEWNPLNILHRVSTFTHETQQTKTCTYNVVSLLPERELSVLYWFSCYIMNTVQIKAHMC